MLASMDAHRRCCSSSGRHTGQVQSLGPVWGQMSLDMVACPGQLETVSGPSRYYMYVHVFYGLGGVDALGDDEVDVAGVESVGILSGAVHGEGCGTWRVGNAVDVGARDDEGVAHSDRVEWDEGEKVMPLTDDLGRFAASSDPAEHARRVRHFGLVLFVSGF